MADLIIGGLGVPELLIILAVVLLLFGGSRLAGLGKSTGRALKEFKEETRGIKGEEPPVSTTPPQATGATSDTAASWPQTPESTARDLPPTDARRDV
ncbi:MAG: twin-arginine translocase TatA/TatE family subunit [Actinomycetes bacterium]